MSSSKVLDRLPALAPVLVAALTLSACAGDPHPELTARVQQLLPSEQYRIKVTTRPDQIALGVHPAGRSQTQEAALAQFVSQWRDDGGGSVSLQAPSDAADPASARRMADQVAALIVGLGVPAAQVKLSGYASGRKDAPVLATYDRYEAIAPNCSAGWGNVVARGANIPYDHFGCAITANIAREIANPRDLLAPAVMTPADDSRREVVLGHYRKGEVTSTAQDSQASGRTSGSQ